MDAEGQKSGSTNATAGFEALKRVSVFRTSVGEMDNIAASVLPHRFRMRIDLAGHYHESSAVPQDGRIANQVDSADEKWLRLVQDFVSLPNPTPDVSLQDVVGVADRDCGG